MFNMKSGLINDKCDTALEGFYSGANVLVTGGTGFMGKVLVEKLLRSCPKINSIYLLVRSKRGKNGEERIEEMMNLPCFKRIKEEEIEFKSKLIAVEADIGLEGLGISEQDRQLLAQNVNIVFHVAATVKFDEHLTNATKLNVRGTREVLALCKMITNLKSVIYVSTAYSNCPISDIDECFYEPPITCELAIEIAENLDDVTVDSMTPTLLGDWPNTYTFTKLLAEDMVKKHGKGLPIGVFRPAIVICTYNEPMPGWVELTNGPMAILNGVVTGVIRTTQANWYGQASLVPCDWVINGIIATAWDVAENATSRTDIPIYNFTASSTNLVKWCDYFTSYTKHYSEKPSSKAIWYPYYVFTTYRLFALILRFFLHILPAIFMDLYLFITGRKPRMMRIYKKIHNLSDVLAYFGSRSWHFRQKNVISLWEKMDKKDQLIFKLDMRSMDWNTFFKVSYSGLRKYLLNEDEKNIQATIDRYNWLFYLHRSTQVLCFFFVLWIGNKLSSLLTAPLFYH